MANIPLTSKQMSMDAVAMLNISLPTTQGWAVILWPTPYVARTQWWADEVMHQGEKDTYYVEAQDELEAFMKARKMEAENNERY